MIKNRYNKFKIFIAFIYLCISINILLLNVYSPKKAINISYHINYVFNSSYNFFSTLPIIYKTYIRNISYIKSLEEENSLLLSKINDLMCVDSKISIIQNENKELKKLLSLNKNSELYNLKKIISFPLYSINLHTHTAIINSKKTKEIKDNLPVLTNKALLGRTIDTNEHNAKILFITNNKSRVPVYTKNSNINAIIVGNNTKNPLLISYDKEINLKEEEMVLTSGLDGIFPRNIPVGTIFKTNNQWFVKPLITLNNIYYIQIICSNK